MSKWECSKCGKKCVLDMVDEQEYCPVYCPVSNASGTKTDWHPVDEPATNCSQLPDWCKVGEWVYSPCDGGCYCKITDIDGDRIFTRSGGDAICFHIKPGDNFSSLRLSRARLRPWKGSESINKVVITGGDTFGIVIGCTWSMANVSGQWINCKKLRADDYKQPDGSPCGVLEHLENGEWVK